MKPHKYVEPDGSFWRGLCVKCAHERDHPTHQSEAAVELAGNPQTQQRVSRTKGAAAAG